jgi:predicted O-methyltransferase YrrM
MSAFAEFEHRLAFDAYNELDVEGHEVDLQGWVNPGFCECFQAIASQFSSPFVIEVGTYKGASAVIMADTIKEGKILCVDTWLGAPEFWTDVRDMPKVNGYPTIFYKFTRNVKKLGLQHIITPFPISSQQASDVLKNYQVQADIIYIDGSHEYEAVLSDLKAWWPVLKDGGYMIGDDFSDCHPGVIKAVTEFFPTGAKRIGDVWCVKKEKI